MACCSGPDLVPLGQHKVGRSAAAGNNRIFVHKEVPADSISLLGFARIGVQLSEEPKALFRAE
jgi:hypothetical protein